MKAEEINTLLKQLKDIAKELALAIPMIDSTSNLGHLHSQSLDLLIGLSELESKIAQTMVISIDSQVMRTKMSTIDEDQEVKKVRGRLLRWGNNPNQINSRILTLFLKLKKTGEPVTVDALRLAYGNASEFDKNFVQMKMISERNHGKVFDVEDGFIELWPKVREYVEAFANQVGI